MTLSVGDITGLLALILSAYAVWTTARFNKRQLALVASQEALNEQQIKQGKSADEEARRADLGVSFVKVSSNSWRFKVFNRGKAPARHVTIEFIEGGDTFIASDVSAKFPLEILEPQQGVELVAAVHMGTRPKHIVNLRWSDDSKADNEKTLYPTL